MNENRSINFLNLYEDYKCSKQSSGIVIMYFGEQPLGVCIRWPAKPIESSIWYHRKCYTLSKMKRNFSGNYREGSMWGYILFVNLALMSTSIVDHSCSVWWIWILNSWLMSILSRILLCLTVDVIFPFQADLKKINKSLLRNSCIRLK